MSKDRLHTRKSKKPKKLTAEQKRIVNQKPKTNAGIGWSNGGTNPNAFYEGWDRRR